MEKLHIRPPSLPKQKRKAGKLKATLPNRGTLPG